MNVFAKFDAIPLMIFKVIKETKRYGHTVGRSNETVFMWLRFRMDGRSDNVKTVYPPTNIVCGGIMRINLEGSTKLCIILYNTMDFTGIRQGMGMMHSDVMDTFFLSGDAWDSMP